MHQVACQPHTRMVVQITCRVKRLNRLVDDGEACTSLDDIARKFVSVIYILNARPNTLKNSIAKMAPDVMEKSSPGELGEELVCGFERLMSSDGLDSLRKG